MQSIGGGDPYDCYIAAGVDLTQLRVVRHNRRAVHGQWYRLLELRLERAALLRTLQQARRRSGLPVSEFVPAPVTLWRFARGRDSVRMLRAQAIRGGDDGNTAESFRCTVHQLDGAVRLEVSGEIDLASVASFRAQLTAAAHRTGGLIVDVRNISYIDSSGINALLDADRALAPSRRRIALVAPPAMLRKLLGVLKLEDRMPAFDGVDDALAYIHNGDSAEPHAAG